MDLAVRHDGDALAVKGTQNRLRKIQVRTLAGLFSPFWISQEKRTQRFSKYWLWENKS